MRCADFVELVTAYLDDQLSGEVRADFEEHLRLCPGCDRYLDQFRATIALLGQLPEETISSTARARLLTAFAGWRPGEPGKPGEPGDVSDP